MTRTDGEERRHHDRREECVDCPVVKKEIGDLKEEIKDEKKSRKSLASMVNTKVSISHALTALVLTVSVVVTFINYHSKGQAKLEDQMNMLRVEMAKMTTIVEQSKAHASTTNLILEELRQLRKVEQELLRHNIQEKKTYVPGDFKWKEADQ